MPLIASRTAANTPARVRQTRPASGARLSRTLMGLVVSLAALTTPAAALRPPPEGPALPAAPAMPELLAPPESLAPTVARGASLSLRGRWLWPVQPRPEVVHRFERPASPYGAGHRGIDVAAAVGQGVGAVADGVVTHRGVIAGRPTITLTHPDGIRSTYEPVASDLTTGTEVSAGDRIGVVTGGSGHCPPDSCLHLGALRGQTYLDPLTLLGQRRVRLLPVP